MGEARRRGTREERVAGGIARREAWERQRAAENERLRIERLRIASARQKQLALLPPEERKEAVLAADDRHVTSALLHALLASAAGPVFAIKRRP